MFKETSHEKLFFTEHWPSSNNTIKSDFSKSMKSFSNYTSKNNSLSNSRSCSRSCSFSSSSTSINNPIRIIESLNNSKILTSQESLLYIIEEE